jgi:hypothetical protein
MEVRNESYSAADDLSGQPGDFVIADTTFHITIAPTTGHFDKCKRNLQDGRRVGGYSCLCQIRFLPEQGRTGSKTLLFLECVGDLRPERIGEDLASAQF